ncbi:hypothetical protein OIU77_017314 [Salix suchowensis]|uniref:Leucine-rich repeat-containing N-terminal plant-type domain-containing protein n=1 Tax=Salix suchowensis TaxID=1278906 RepID=A0ABQ8ZNW0_9ROSI|nr:hypothetical protein OIU77_017314 [Salix suchowensis]
MPSSVRFLTVRMFSLLLLLFIHLRACHSSPSIHPQCHDEESHALLQFKQSLAINESASFDPSAYPKVASWKVDGESGDCCSWDGVECDRDSGHVIGLDLSSSFLYGSIDSNSTLFHLVHLRRLNLADNDFNNSEIPSEIRNLPRLFDLNLSMSLFSGQIPAEILELSKLVSIDLGLNSLKLQKPGLQHLVEALTNLEVLHLSGVDISAKGEFPMGIFQLPNLRFLRIRSNPYLTGYLPEFQSGSQLELLMLGGSGTSFSGLRLTNLYGEIPSCLGNLTQLAVLKLHKNKLAGQIPSWIGNHTLFISLGLGPNRLHGPIPESIFRLPNLEELDLQKNLFRGTVNVGLLRSRSLVSFQLSGNNLSVIGNINDSIALPKFQILGLGGCNLSGEFPSFLHGQNHLEFVELGGNQIEGHIPKWFMNLGTETLWHLDLSGNFLTGFEQSVDILPWNNLRDLKLSGNKLEGALPIPPRSIISYMVSDNRLTGEIPQAICNLPSLVFLQLSSNNLSSKLPQCLGNISHSASVLDLRNNSFSGDIPDSFSNDCTLRAIDFSQNQFEGKIPRSLANCAELEILNIEKNKINDVFPSWLGIFPKLRVLILRSNRLHGVIGKPRANFEFQRLQIVDLSDNCFRALDLSQNKLTGEIPVQLAQLTFLAVFNVSGNVLSGPIPRGNQFDTFDRTSFDANPGLCGKPLSRKCGNGEDSLLAAKRDEGSAAYPLEFGWKVVVIGYASGLVIGVILGCVMDTRKYEWLVKNYFARWQR